MIRDLIITEYRIKNENGNVFCYENDRVSFDRDGVIIKWELFSDYLDQYFEIPLLVIEKKSKSRLEAAREKVAQHLARVADMAG